MSHSKNTQLLCDIIPGLPRRVKVTGEVLNLPFVLGDILTLVLVKTLQIVHAVDRLTGEIVKIPLDFHGKVCRLGKRCSSVAELKLAGSKLFSVEEQFEVPIGPWNKMTIKSGGVVELTSIDCDRDIVVKICQTEDIVRIKEDTPLHIMTVVDENLRLKDIVEISRFPLNVVVLEQFEQGEVSNECRMSGNYKLEHITNEDFVVGYREESQKHFLIPTDCNIWVNEEVSFPKISKPYKNAFVVPKDMYNDITLNNLYLEYINYTTKKSEIESVIPEVPPRLLKSGINRRSLMSNNTDTCPGPTRPERKRQRLSTVSAENQKPFERHSLEEDLKCRHLSDEDVKGIAHGVNAALTNIDVYSDQYMDLNPDIATGHVYDEMHFHQEETNSQSATPPQSNRQSALQTIRCACRCFGSCSRPTHMQLMSASQVVVLLNENGLTRMAEICAKNKLDGAFLSELKVDELMSEPFNQSEEQVDTFVSLLSNTNK